MGALDYAYVALSYRPISAAYVLCLFSSPTRIDSDNEGEMPSEEELRGLRYACYKCWSTRIIRIWGIRVQPPPCVLE